MENAKLEVFYPIWNLGFCTNCTQMIMHNYLYAYLTQNAHTF